MNEVWANKRCDNLKIILDSSRNDPIAWHCLQGRVQWCDRSRASLGLPWEYERLHLGDMRWLSAQRNSHLNIRPSDRDESNAFALTNRSIHLGSKDVTWVRRLRIRFSMQFVCVDPLAHLLQLNCWRAECNSHRGYGRQLRPKLDHVCTPDQ